MWTCLLLHDIQFLCGLLGVFRGTLFLYSNFWMQQAILISMSTLQLQRETNIKKRKKKTIIKNPLTKMGETQNASIPVHLKVLKQGNK